MINVLVVDDSSFMRKVFTHILESDPDIKVMDTAEDGKDAIRKAKEIHPDVILLDVLMPVMDGRLTLNRIMAECPAPVIIISAIGDNDSDAEAKLLEFGAVGFIAKPSGVISYDIEKLKDEIIDKVKFASKVSVKRSALRNTIGSKSKQLVRAEKKLVIIGASTGGPHAISTILSNIPADFMPAIIVVVHMSHKFVESFVKRLSEELSLDICVAKMDDIISYKKVFFAPGDCNLVIVKRGVIEKIELNWEPTLNSPSIDLAMESAARVYGDEVLGVLLTGMGDDGARGLQAIKEAGGSTIAEDESTCCVYGMPRVAIEMGVVDEVVVLENIATSIIQNI